MGFATLVKLLKAVRGGGRERRLQGESSKLLKSVSESEVTTATPPSGANCEH